MNTNMHKDKYANICHLDLKIYMQNMQKKLPKLSRKCSGQICKIMPFRFKNIYAKYAKQNCQNCPENGAALFAL